MATLNDAIAALSDVEIATGSSTSGWLFWKKQTTTYTDLLELYPELIDANGQLDAELAQAILDTREMSEEHQDLLQDAIDAYDDFYESLAVMTDYIEDLFGGLGDSLMDSLVEAFEAGESAAEDFLDSVSSMLEDFVSDMVYSLAFADYFNDASEKIAAIQTGYDTDGSANEYADMTDEEKLEAQMGVLADLYANVDSNMDYANALLEKAQELGESYGYSLYSDDDRTSTSSSGITASQESVDSVDGRLTVMQAHTYNISEKSDTIADYTKQLLGSNQQMLEHLYGIEKNTSHCARLEQIEDYMGDVKSSMADVKTSLATIETKGVKLRT
ncbi:MAG: hypothetical protein SNI20_05945 [Rikenellaceae bacterium]